MKTTELMTKNLVTCRSTDDLEHVARLMAQYDIGWLAVVDEQRRPIGAITDRDICLAALGQRKLLADIDVSTAMSPRVFSAAPDDDVHDVERVMADRKIRRMPVTDTGGRIIGVISLDDLARASGRGDVPSDEIAKTLAAICEPPPGHVVRE